MRNMKLKYENMERKKLLDLIIAIAMEVHESGIQVATKLDVPTNIIWDIRQRSPRADMIRPCTCNDCDPEKVKHTEDTERRLFLNSMTKGFM